MVTVYIPRGTSRDTTTIINTSPTTYVNTDSLMHGKVACLGTHICLNFAQADFISTCMLRHAQSPLLIGESV